MENTAGLPGLSDRYDRKDSEMYAKAIELIHTMRMENESLKARAALADELAAALQRIEKWLDRLTETAEREAKSTRFETMREAWEADSRNYRATNKDVKAALAKWEKAKEG